MNRAEQKSRESWKAEDRHDRLAIAQHYVTHRSKSGSDGQVVVRMATDGLLDLVAQAEAWRFAKVCES